MTSNLLEQLADDTGLPPALVRAIVRTAPDRYKIYSIPKKDGGRRVIAHPARELKIIQRSLLRLHLQDLPIHDAAKAYRKGVSLLENAQPHVGSDTIIKMDFKNFFSSIRVVDWINYCRTRSVYANDEDIKISSLVLFHRQINSSMLRLSVGAPTSPLISNVLLYEFDKLVMERLPSSKICYTRYADDLTFSAPRAGYLHGVQTVVAKIVRGLQHPRLDINGEKTRTITKKYLQKVTGLTLTPGAITVGRDYKRLIHASVHRYSNGKLDLNEVRILSGKLAYINSVEPAFLNTLRTKYGEATLSQLQKMVWKGPLSGPFDIP